MEAIILAGGKGTRLREAAGSVPKPMAAIHGRPFLEYLMTYWQGQGVRRFILSVGYRREVIQSCFGKSFGKSEIIYSVEKQALGTGGGLLQAMRYLNHPRTFLALNGDTFFKVPLTDWKRKHVLTHAGITLALTSGGCEDRYEGIQLDSRRRLCGITARGRGVVSSWVNGGAYLIQPQALSEFKKSRVKKMSFEDQILPRLLEAGGRVFGYPSNGTFIDIGTPASYKAAAKLLKEIK